MTASYVSPDSELPAAGFLLLLVCLAFVGVTFTLLCVFKRERWRMYTALGVIAAVLILFAAFLLIGTGTVQSGGTLTPCPTALQGIQLEPVPGKDLPGGIAECRDISQRNTVFAGVATALGVGIAVGGILSRQRRARSAVSR